MMSFYDMKALLVVELARTRLKPLYERVHKIINDRIENSIKGRQIGHTGESGRGLLCISTTVVMLAGLVLPWRTLHPSHSPRPARRGD